MVVVIVVLLLSVRSWLRVLPVAAIRLTPPILCRRGCLFRCLRLPLCRALDSAHVVLRSVRLLRPGLTLGFGHCSPLSRCCVVL